MSRYNLDYFDNLDTSYYIASVEEEEDRYSKSPYYNRWNKHLEETDE